MVKGIININDLENTIELTLNKSKNKEIYIETDMRALYNPMRMKNIEAATRNLVENILNICPICNCPGLKQIERIQGLPCKQCGLPTKSVLSYVYECVKCKHKKEIFYPNGETTEEPGSCQYCNP